MISARLQGGLCNQIFQIAAASALAWRNNDVAIFNFEDCYTPLQGNKATKYADTVFKNVIQGEVNVDCFWREPNHEYTPIPYQPNMLLDGYFQSHHYFEDFVHKIRELFSTYDLRDTYDGYTGIQVRRGDYLRFPDIFHQCTVEYYKEAMKRVGEKFIVVSDDIEWCKQNIMGDNIEYSEGHDDVYDLSILASCKNIIGANSTFALIGYHLNKNEDKTGVFPKRWFGPAGPSSRTIYPEDVIKL